VVTKPKVSPQRVDIAPMRRESPESLSGVSTARLAALGCVHVSTARRWKRTGKCPRAIAQLVRVCERGELGEIDRAWAGWRIVHGNLYSPEGWEFTPGAVRTIPLLQAQVREHRRARGFIGQADWLSGRFEIPSAHATETPHREPPATHVPGRRYGGRNR
jgi:hypothetical protein